MMSQRPDISRRDFFLGRFTRAENQASSPPERSALEPLVMRYPKSSDEVAAGNGSPLPPGAESASSAAAARRRTIPVLRPPGAVREEEFLRGCTRCERCIEVCPHGAIIHAPPRMREAAGTPMIDVDRQPCLMCADFPCINACEPRVLTSLIPPAMGTARVTEHLCLAHHGTPCTVCSEHCPVDQAIALSGGKPAVDEAACTGCGVCRHVCPAPENAILLMPTFLRPLPTQAPPHE